ncbi:MAG: hypothetical protein PHV55_02340, partial [Candidatus Omnitrophica bacterium]|nr:hypothetical protein [Candidatus Omnitrophota bacterium]
MKNLKSKRGFINNKIVFISVVILGCLIFGISIRHFELSKAGKHDRAVLHSPVSTPQKAKVKLSAASRKALLDDYRKHSRTSFGVSEADASAREVPSSLSDNDPGVERSVWRIKGYMKNIADTNNFLKEKVVLLNNLLETKEKVTAKLAEENARLKEEIAVTVESKNRLKEKFTAAVTNLNLQLAQKDLNISNLTTAKLNLQAEINNVNNKLSSLEASRVNLENQFNATQSAKTALEEQLNKVKEEVSKQVAVNDALNKNMAQLSEAIREKEQQKQSVAMELENLKEFKKNIEAELVDLRNSKNDLAATYANLENQLNLAQGAKATLEEQLGKITEEL